jgi:superfamily I DNA/RNA helicase
MAIMFPPIFPGIVNPVDPEFTVFESLKKLSDDFFIFYSKRFKGVERAKEEVEIDFIVFDGNKTILCLEVKGGELVYDPAMQSWTQNGKTMKVGPDRQATAACHSLIRYMGNRVRNINVDWALCFPQCSKPNSTRIPEIDPQLILDESFLINVEQSISAIFSLIAIRHQRSGVSKQEGQDIVNSWNRTQSFVPKIGVRIIRDSEQLVKISTDQFEILEDLEINPRVVVSGYAGTGKTLLAQEHARRRESIGGKVLFLCYNKALAKKIRYGYQRDSNVQVSTFHSFSKRLIEEKLPGWWESNKKQTQSFWDDEVPLALLEIEPTEIPKFDGIVIDEGQDFKTDWLEFIEGLLKDQKMGSLCMFLDEQQDIFKHWSSIPWLERSTKKILRKNCRNTRNIIGYLKDILPSEMTPNNLSPEGLSVVIREAEEQSVLRKQIEKDLRELLAKEEVQPSDIVILSKAPFEESILKPIQSINGIPLVSMGDRFDSRKKEIQYTTIRVFKGLEAPVVFVVDLIDVQSDDFAKVLYTSASRAQVLLYTFTIKRR